MAWIMSLFTHTPDNELFKAPQREVNRVFLHCSASDNPAHDDILVIKRWHLDRGFNDVGYHYFITSFGVIQLGRDLEITPAAQQGHNAHTIAICMHGLTKFTNAQFDTLRALCRAIARELPNVTFHGHREVANKACPVFDYKQVLSLDAKGHLTI